MTDIPDPEITARLVTDDDLPTSARRFLDRLGPQWKARTTFSRGPVITSRYKHAGGRIAGCLLVQFSDDTNGGGCAYFLDGKFAGGFTWLWCSECTGEGFAHAVSVPIAIEYRDLCRLVSET